MQEAISVRNPNSRQRICINSKAKLKIKLKAPVIYPGQLVYLKQEVSKHTARHLYVIMSEPKNDLVCIKKILHFHSNKLGRYLNIEHTVKVTDLLPLTSYPDDSTEIDVLREVKNIITYNPKLTGNTRLKLKYKK